MSVDRTDYIIYGWKLPYDLCDSKGEYINLMDENFSSMIEGWPGEEFIIIESQMTDEYVVFGLILYQNDGYSSWEFVKLDFKKLDAKKIKKRYKEIFEIEGKIPEPELFIFSHFS